MYLLCFLLFHLIFVLFLEDFAWHSSHCYQTKCPLFSAFCFDPQPLQVLSFLSGETALWQMSPGLGYVIPVFEVGAAARGTPPLLGGGSSSVSAAPWLFPAPASTSTWQGFVLGKQEVPFSPAPPKTGLISQLFFHIQPSTHLFVRKFGAFLCCLLFAAMLGTLLATPNWTDWGYWEAPKLAHILLLETCLHPAVC